MHRELIKRAPGQYALGWLSNRIGVCNQTVRNYNTRLGIVVEPRATTISWITWSNLDSLSTANAASPYGLWLEDRHGTKYPPRQDAAAWLLRHHQTVALRRQGANYYWLR